MNTKDTQLLIRTLKEVLNLRMGYLHEQYEIDDPHDDPDRLCVDLSYLIHKLKQVPNFDFIARQTVAHREATMTFEDKVTERSLMYRNNPHFYQTDFDDLVDTQKINPDGTLYDWGD